MISQKIVQKKDKSVDINDITQAEILPKGLKAAYKYGSTPKLRTAQNDFSKTVEDLLSGQAGTEDIKAAIE